MGNPRTTRRQSLAILIAFPALVASQEPGPRLTSPGLSVTLSPTDGHVLRILDGTGRHLAGAPSDTAGLWSLALAPGQPFIRSTMAGRFAWRATGPRELALTWDRFGAAASRLRVSATVRLRPDSTLAWRIRLDGIRALGVEAVHYPRLTGIPSLGEAEELAVPQWMGERTRTPRRLLVGADGSSRRMEWSYPGQLSLQALSLTGASGAGLYLAADDPNAFRKAFALWGEGADAAGYDLVHVPSNPGRDDTYAPSYAALVGAVSGGWFSAIERYRAWGTRQAWARDSRLANRRSPAWVRETAIWVWNRGRANQVLEPAAMLQRDAGLPVSVFWHWWHGGPYDTSFPDYLPPRDGVERFTAAVAAAHAAGLHAITYMNQRLWCVNTPSWAREGAERWAVRERDGRVREETYNVFDPQPCAPMDISTRFWRDKYAGIADTVLNHYGVDGIYMDQAVLSLVCWSPDHGHPVGGGHYWMDGFRTLARDLRRRTARVPRVYAGEGGGESWLPDLDAFLTLQVSQERYMDPAAGWEPIPIFQAAYHRQALTYGTYGSLTWPPYDELWPDSTRPANALTLLDEKYRFQYYLEQARMFVWGMQPTIANFLPEQLTARRAQVDYLERLARLRHGLRRYFRDGTMLRPPDVRTTQSSVLASRVSIYAARRGGAQENHLRSPDVLGATWRARNGRVAIALASISERPTDAEVAIDPVALGFPRGARLLRHDAKGSTDLGRLAPRPARMHHVPLEALQAAVLELVPLDRSGTRVAAPR